MPTNNYMYTLLSGSKFYTCLFNNYSNTLSQTILQYKIKEYDFLELSNRVNNSLSPNSSNISLYPLAVRYASPDNNLFVIERPPFQIEVDFSNNKSYQNRTSPKYLNSVKIWVPWTVSVISVAPGISSSFSSRYSFSIYFNNKPMVDFTENLVPCFFPNSSAGDICMGQDSAHVCDMINSKAPITEIYNYLFNSYFSGWNSDIYNNLPYPVYFYQKNIMDRISQTKKGPKNYFQIFNATRSSRTSSTYNQMFYILSSLSLEETLDYISHIKNSGNTYSKSLIDRITRLNKSGMYSSDLTQYASSGFMNCTDISSMLSKYFDSSEYSVCRVLINNSSAEYNQHYFSNPYLVSQIYKEFKSKQNHFEDSIVINLTFEHEDLSSYFPISSMKDNYNVVSS
jgi:hypothetical protein